MKFINDIHSSYNRSKTNLLINNTIKIIEKNSDVKYNDRENKSENKKILTIIACHTNSIIKYNTLINNIPHLVYPNNDIVIINSSNEKLGEKLKKYIQSDVYPHKNNIIHYLEIPNDDKHIDFGKYMYALNFIQNNKSNDLHFDFIVFINDSIVIKKSIGYFYNLMIKNNKELYAYNDSNEQKHHFQSYLFAIRFNVIDKLMNYYENNKLNIRGYGDVIQILELKLNEIYTDNDCFLKVANISMGKNIFFNIELYTLLFNSGILPFIKLKTVRSVRSVRTVNIHK
jgi:hypothetical protein